MVNWQIFVEKILPQKPSYRAELIQIDDENQIGVFYDINESSLYFGFIRNSDQQTLSALILMLDDCARKNSKTQIIGPIDGATWGNYRFQWQTELPLLYSGQPTYTRKNCDQFMNSGYEICERYETVQIAHIQKVEQDLQMFKKNTITDLKFEKPTSAMFAENRIELLTLLNEIFAENFQYSQMTDVELQIVFLGIQKFINYDLSLVARNSQNQIVGFMLNATSEQALFLKTIGFKKEYRHQGLSVFKIMEQLFTNIANQTEFKMQQIIICLMKKNNFPSLISAYLTEHKNEYVLLRKLI